MKRYVLSLLLAIALCLSMDFSALAASEPTFFRPGWLSSAFLVPQTVTRIEAEAFEGDTSLTQVSLGSSVKSVGQDAFSGCSGIERIFVSSRNVTLAPGALGQIGEDKEIWAPAGSTAEAYAKAYGYTFCRVPVDATDLLEYAVTQLGTKYVHGSNDCIMYARRCFLKVFGITIPDNCNSMYYLTSQTVWKNQKLSATRITDINDLMPGDIICWNNGTSTSCSHVGIYMGACTINGVKYSDGSFIEASSSAGYVRVNNLDKSKLTSSYAPYYLRTFMCAWRIL